MGLPFAVQREAVPRRQVALEFGGGGQLLPLRRCVGFGDRRAAAVVVASRRLYAAGRTREAAVRHRQYRIQQGEAAANRQRARGRPVDRVLDAADSCTARVLGLHDAVQARVGELEVIPVFLEYRAVDAQGVAQPAGLPAELVILQGVGLVLGADGVGAARAEALGDRRIDQPLIVELIGGGELRRRAAALRNLEELLAGRTVGGGQRRIGAFRLRGLKTRIALLGVLISVVAQAAEQADVRGCVPGDFAEGRVVALDED